MKVTLINTLLYLLFLDRTCGQKEKLFASESGGAVRERSEASVVEESGNIFQGRSGTTLCGPGSVSRHHDMPCDEDVESNGDESTSISTRNDPVIKPEETETDVCVSSDGVYGLVTLNTISVTYEYEMQTDGGVDSTAVKNEILPTLEKKIVDSLLPDLFPDECPSIAIGKRSLSEIVDVVGVSMHPQDYISKNDCTQLSAQPETECFVLLGEMKIYVDNDQTVAANQIIEERTRVDKLIEINMNSGNYDDAQENIQEVYYFKKMDPTEPNETNETNENDGQIEKRKNRSLRMGLFVGIGTLGAVLAGVLFRVTRRMRTTDDQTEIQPSAIQTYLDVEEQRPSFS